MDGEGARTTDLERAIARWARAERLRSVPDLWPPLRPRLAAAPGLPPARRPAVGWGVAAGRVALSAAAALAATYVAGPWVYGSAPGVIPRMVNWAAAAPAWLFSWWGGWWQVLVCRLVGGC